jgi:NADPH2:quinone reductase
MKAITAPRPLPATDPACLEDTTLPDPVPGPQDLLVAVRAVSVNPVDTKVRMRASTGPVVLGYDAMGIVQAVGSGVTLFAPGDAVFYAGALNRPGTNSALHLVDERITGPAPKTLTPGEAAALPLTAITAWEMLFDRLGVTEGEAGVLLVIGGAGGVGSMLIQIARALTGLTVVATASRPASRDWCLAMGAHHVIDHSGDMAAQLAALGLTPRHIASTTQTDRHFATLAAVVAPQGRIALIDDPDMTRIDIGLLKRKSVSLHWEFMFTRSMFTTPDMIEQHRLLARIAALVDEGRIRSTMTQDMGPITAENLRRAHLHQESGTAIGKTVLTGF